MDCSLYIITWYARIPGHKPKVWTSERWSRSAGVALKMFRRDANRLRHPVVVLGIAEYDGRLSLRLVVA